MAEETKKEQAIPALENLTQDQALGILIQAARIGQKAGAYTLEDAEVIARAIKVFVPTKPTETTENKEEKPA